LTLAKDLRNVGIDVVLDRWHCPPGSNLNRYIERIDASEYVVVVGTPGLRHKYQSTTADSVVAAEINLINNRLMQPKTYGDKVIPLLRTGSQKDSFPPLLQPMVSIDFQAEERYFRNLFTLILTLYRVPLDHPALEDLW